MSEFSAETLIALNKVMGESGQTLPEDSLHAAFASVDYYETVIEQIASIGRSIMQNHPFVDGNKRTGTFFILNALAAKGIQVEKTDDEIIDFAVKSVTERWSVEKIVAWLK